MKVLVAVLLGLHAFAHLVGFVWPWWVSEPLPYSTEATVGMIDDASMRSVSALWLVTAAAFVVAAVTRLFDMRAWRDITTAAAVASLLLSVACLPSSFPGVAINTAILVLLRPGRPVRRFA